MHRWGLEAGVSSTNRRQACNMMEQTGLEQEVLLT